MAKVMYASYVTGLSGRTANSVFFRSPSSSYGYMRNYVYPEITENNTNRGKEFQNMTKVLKEVDPAAIADLKAYAKKYAKLPTVGGDGLKARANNHVAVWILALWNLRKTEGPTIELSSISLGDLVTLFNFTSVADIVDTGFLPAVDGWQDLVSPLNG
ncbi:MAG: hypothetical protein WCR98_09080 [Saccharofermentanales bacterium]